MNDKNLEMKAIIALVVVVLIISAVCGGSIIMDNYTPPDTSDSDSTSDSLDIAEDITYNNDVLKAVTGGYSGAPTIIASDNRVFYIPQEYCNGSYLKNFRVIGLNQDNAKMEKVNGKDTYKGAVILYGFQTTYKADYGADYNFEYEPYDYDVEYEMVEKAASTETTTTSSKKSSTSSKKNKKNTETTTETTTAYQMTANASVEMKKNEKAVDDSGFKVATIVMEHEIGSNINKILYCDAGDDITVSTLDVGQNTLITSYDDSALTICHKNKIVVYGFDKDYNSYGTKDVYMYKIEDLLDSITFKNALAAIGYCSVKYNVVGDVSYSNTSDGWVRTWLSKMSTRKTVDNITDVSYLSKLTESTAKKSTIHSGFINMENFINEQIDKAYSAYQWTSSGWFSKSYSKSIDNFGNYTFQKSSDLQWILTNDIRFNLQETSKILFKSKTYKGTADGKVTVTITPEFKLDTDYDYSITDLLLTKYVDTGTQNKYSIVLQMMVTPKKTDSKKEKLEELDKITDFKKYADDVAGTNPDTEVAEDEEETEEYLEKDLNSKYITLNINLSQLNGTEKVEDTEVTILQNAKEVEVLFENYKKQYGAEYNASLSNFEKEVKTGTNIIPKLYTIDSINEFKEKFKLIKDKCKEIENKEKDIEDAKGEVAAINETIKGEVEEANKMAESFTGDFAITDKETKDETGYYKELNQLFNWDNDFEQSITTKDINSFAKSYADAIDYCANYNSMSYKSTEPAKNEWNNIVKVYGNNSTNKTDIGNGLASKLCKDMSYMVTISNNNSKGKNVAIRLDCSDESYYDGEKNIYYLGILDTNTMNQIKSMDLSELKQMNAVMNSIQSNIYEIDFATFYKASLITAAQGKCSSMIKKISDKISTMEKLQNMAEFCTSDGTQKLLKSINNRFDYMQKINDYEEFTIPALEEELAQLNTELAVLEEEFDKTKFSVDLYWKEKKLDGDWAAKSYKEYDEIIAVADSYISTFNDYIPTLEYSTSAETVIKDIKTLNTDANINVALENMYTGLLNDATSRNKYGTAFNNLTYLYNHRNNFYYNITTSINKHADIAKSETVYSDKDELTLHNANISVLKAEIKKHYTSNKIADRSYSLVEKDCQTIYKSAYPSFDKITIQDNGKDKEFCDITVDDVRKEIYDYFIENGVTELKDGDKTYTLAKTQDSQGNVYENTDTTTEGTTEATDENVVKSVYAASSKLTDYTATLIWQYKKIANIVGDRAFGDGVLNTTQKEAMKPDAANPDKDVTSTYNTGYLKAVNLLNEIAESVNNNSVYYEQRAKTQKAIAEAQNKGLSLVLKDDVYYSELYRRKCDEADAIQKLLYNAAKARTDKEREEYVKEYQNTDWIIVDENFQVDSDLRSALVVTRKGLETTYQRVDWNTSLIGEDEKSNTSDTAYQLFPLKSNFCLCVAGNTATVVPMGTQRDVSVASLNKNIKEQLEATGITEIENVIYGSLADIENAGSDYDVLLFSGEGKKGQANPWFMIAFKQEGKDITIDTSNITGYYGTYKTSDDPHFLEYEHSTITGMNQFASTTLEEGYQLYNVSLKTDGGEITKDTGASSISGSFFNSWSRSDGMVVLLGFTQEDKVIESTEYTTATVDTEEGNTTTTVAAKSENGVTTTVEGTTEETSEPETRAINEDDIYDANIYVLKYDTKAAVGEAAKNVTDSSAVNYAMGDLFDAGIELEGPFGELLQGPVNLLTLALRAVFALAYALGVLYCVYLGLKLSKAKDAAEREKAKLHIKWFIIAVIGTHILIVFMYLAKTQLTQWHYSVTEVTTTVTDK